MDSEYTSVSWDGKNFGYLGDFVFEAYTHAKNSGVISRAIFTAVIMILFACNKAGGVSMVELTHDNG